MEENRYWFQAVRKMEQVRGLTQTAGVIQGFVPSSAINVEITQFLHGGKTDVVVIPAVRPELHFNHLLYCDLVDLFEFLMQLIEDLDIQKETLLANAYKVVTEQTGEVYTFNPELGEFLLLYIFTLIDGTGEEPAHFEEAETTYGKTVEIKTAFRRELEHTFSQYLIDILVLIGIHRVILSEMYQPFQLS